MHNSSNTINEELESRFQKADIVIDSVRAKLDNEMKITNDLIAKTKGVHHILKMEWRTLIR